MLIISPKTTTAFCKQALDNGYIEDEKDHPLVVEVPEVNGKKGFLTLTKDNVNGLLLVCVYRYDKKYGEFAMLHEMDLEEENEEIMLGHFLGEFQRLVFQVD